MCLVFIPPLCNGSISDFDSESVGSSPAGGAIFYPCRIMEVCLVLTQEAEDRNLSGVPEESR